MRENLTGTKIHGDTADTIGCGRKVLSERGKLLNDSSVIGYIYGGVPICDILRMPLLIDYNIYK